MNGSVAFAELVARAAGSRGACGVSGAPDGGSATYPPGGGEGDGAEGAARRSSAPLALGGSEGAAGFAGTSRSRRSGTGTGAASVSGARDSWMGSPSRWRCACASIEGACSASRSPMTSLGRAGSVAPLVSCGGVTTSGPLPAGGDAGCPVSARCSETRALLDGAQLQRTLRRIGIARTTHTTRKTRTARNVRVRGAGDVLKASTACSSGESRQPGQSGSSARSGAEHAVVCRQFCVHSGQ